MCLGVGAKTVGEVWGGADSGSNLLGRRAAQEADDSGAAGSWHGRLGGVDGSGADQWLACLWGEGDGGECANVLEAKGSHRKP